MTSVVSQPTPSPIAAARDPYRGVVLTLLALALGGTVTMTTAGVMLGNPVLLHAAITFGISAGALVGVALAQSLRAAADALAARPLAVPETLPVIPAGEKMDGQFFPLLFDPASM